jgi:hypothetical protein
MVSGGGFGVLYSVWFCLQGQNDAWVVFELESVVGALVSVCVSVLSGGNKDSRRCSEGLESSHVNT